MIFWVKYIFLKLFFPSGRLTLEYELFVRLNNERKKRGLPTLFFQNDLQQVARKHSQDMARHDYFDHTNLKNQSPKDRFKESQVSEVVSGENLAKVRGFRNAVKVAHVGLMNSPGHKANILQKAYNCVGIGLALGIDKTYYFTQNFSFRKIYVTRVPKVLRFSDKLRFKIKILDSNINKILVRIFNRNDEIVVEKSYRISKMSILPIELEVPKNDKYVLRIYMDTIDKTKFRLLNEFEFYKKGLLW